MSHRFVTPLTVLWMLFQCSAPLCAADLQGEPFDDPFVLDGSRILLEEAHLGIVNGKLTTGIPYRDAVAISGLWAPPYASADFRLDVTLADQPVKGAGYTWRPLSVERTGSAAGIDVRSVTALLPGCRCGLIEMTLANPAAEPRALPLTVSVRGSLDRVEWWEFAVTGSSTPTATAVESGRLQLTQGEQAIVLQCSADVQWDAQQATGRGAITVPASGQAKCWIVFAVGPAAEATTECQRVAADPAASLSAAVATYRARVADLFEKLPRFESSNPALTRFYNRSLVHLVMNRWDVPEFALHPNYTTGSVNGGCICNYLWDFGEPWEIFPLYDPAASRTHIQQFVSIDMLSHFSFDPIGAKAWGPWYPVNQEKIVGLIYYYVRHTGDVEFLQTVVHGKSILEHAVANALFGDDLTKAVQLIDYGPSNSHLELRRGFPYNHIMPDLNGRRYDTYLRAAELAEWAGQPAPHLRERAEQLKTVLKRDLWNPQARWFDFQDATGKKDTRYTIQIFKLFHSPVLDAEQEAGLLAHLNSEVEFLSEYGLHSLSKTDIAYDQVDIDNGGGGSYTSFPPQIAERLYKAGQPAAAENILKRILWWGDRAPYWGDSFVANQIDYRKDTPLQCTVGGAAGAQCIIFGMFGVRAEIDGSLRIDPHPPAMAPHLTLRRLKLRGHVVDIEVRGDNYEVREGATRRSAAVGQPTILPAR